MLTPREHTDLLRAEQDLAARVGMLASLPVDDRAHDHELELRRTRGELERVSSRLDGDAEHDRQHASHGWLWRH